MFPKGSSTALWQSSPDLSQFCKVLRVCEAAIRFVAIALIIVNWLYPEFSQPQWLLLLLSLPLLFVFHYRSLVDLPRKQMHLSLAVRLLVVILLTLVLADLTLLKSVPDVFVVFAVDRSDSIDSEKGPTASYNFIEAATAGMDANRYRLLPFAAEPLEFCSLSDLRAPVTDDQTADSDLEAALRLSAATIPPGFVPHVVLLTDGNETVGDIQSAVSSTGVRISAVTLPQRDEPETQVSAVNVPAQVAEGEPFQVEVRVNSNRTGVAVVDLFKGDFRVSSSEEKIKVGENTFSFSEQVSEATTFSARIRSAEADSVSEDSSFQDTLLQNNVASGLVFTVGKPRILLIESLPELAKHIEWAMEEEGIAIETRPATGMPETLSELQKYDALMLSNVPATQLSERQMDLIRRYVSELGGGFVMLGGDDSFGLGGYYKTVVEEVLPVRCDFEKEKEKPGLGMVIIMDKSGSMGGRKIELAREAARGAVELLGEKDQIGVIAFDGSSYWVSEMSSASQKAAVMDRISSIEAGGGTTLYPAMEEAFRALQTTNARLKHVIILTDGYSTPGDFEGITQDMVAARITVSTVGIGDADQNMLEQIAQQGDGRYYFSDDAASIPQIFARETITAGKSGIKEEPFLPVLVRATPVLQDVDFDEAPFLLGHVVTRPRATSEVILTTESGDPLLSWWRYGLGVSVAFTSDAKSQWAAEWLTWPGYNRFWAQVIRHCMRKSETKGFDVEVFQEGRFRRIAIDAFNSAGQFLNGADTQLRVIGPGMEAVDVDVEQVAPGRYEAVIEASKSGAWYLQMTQKVNGRTVHQQSRGLVVGYSDELRLNPPNKSLLETITSTSGGTLNPDAKDVFRTTAGESATRIFSLRPWLLALAMLLFVADVALRRIEFRRPFGRETQEI